MARFRIFWGNRPAGSGTTITVPAGALALTGHAPSVSQSRILEVPAGALALTGHAPAISIGTVIAPPAGSLALTGPAPTLGLPTMLSVPTGALTLTGYSPVLTQTGVVTAFSGQGDLSFWRQKPRVHKPNPLLEGLRDELEGLLSDAPPAIQADVREAKFADGARNSLTSAIAAVRKAALASERQEVQALRQAIDEARKARRRWQRRQNQARILLLE